MKYVFSISLVCLAGMIQLYFKDIFQNALFIIFYPSVFYIVWIAGLRQAILAIFLCSTASLTLFGHDIHDPKALTRTLTFAFSSLMISLIMNRAYKKEKMLSEETDRAYLNEKEHSIELEDLYNNSPCGYHSINKDGDFIKINDYELALLGYSRKDLIGTKIIDIIATKYKKEFEIKFKEFIEIGRIDNWEVEIIKKDGTLLKCLLSSKAIYNQKNQFVMSRATVVDITELHNARENLKLLSLAVEQSPCSIEITDPNGVIIYVNDNFLSKTGYKKEEVIGQNPRFLKSGKTSDETFQTLWEVLKSGKCWNGELINQKKSGEHFIEEIFISPIFDDEKNIKNYIAIKNDITEKRKQSEKIIEQQKQLIQSSRFSTLGEMSAGIAHEINNPLSIIYGKAQTLKKQIDRGQIEPEKIQEDLSKILSTSVRISKIINSLKKFSEDSSRGKMNSFKVSEILDETFDLCLERLKNNSISFSVDQFQDVTIKCHKNQIVQILVNLLNNSLHALEDNIEKWIKISFKIEGQNILIIISDNGCGIANEIRDKLMQPFVTTKTKEKGSGLGLSISLGIAKNHNGNLFLCPHSVNTCFVLELPYEE